MEEPSCTGTRRYYSWLSDEEEESDDGWPSLFDGQVLSDEEEVEADCEDEDETEGIRTRRRRREEQERRQALRNRPKEYWDHHLDLPPPTDDEGRPPPFIFFFPIFFIFLLKKETIKKEKIINWNNNRTIGYVVSFAPEDSEGYLPFLRRHGFCVVRILSDEVRLSPPLCVLCCVHRRWCGSLPRVVLV
jgi:hypothetical protein